jgi:hypothetical protein
VSRIIPAVKTLAAILLMCPVPPPSRSLLRRSGASEYTLVRASLEIEPIEDSRTGRRRAVGASLRSARGQSFDRALRTVKKFGETVVRRGLERQPGDWKWSSYQECAGVSAAEQQERCGLVIDRVRLPADEIARI